ncbi:MAG: hypothetical protein KKB50_05415 [Planctomycetes bacterium]|nr:hypothetical protein [Planctomycetota bacterium]
MRTLTGQRPVPQRSAPYRFDADDSRHLGQFLCNLPAVLVLSPAVLRAAKHYFRRLDGSEMPRYK